MCIRDRVENPEAGIRYFLVKPSDVAIYVEHGAADVGIVGKDILTEASADVYELLDTGLGKDVYKRQVMGTLLTNFVAKPVSAIMSGNYIGILFWACMFGIAMKGIGSESTKIFMANTADAVSQICLLYTSW